jgi:ABC-2 type transport system permease protein
VRKAWIVARHEFAVTVKRLWFVVATFVFPLFMLAIAGSMLLLAKHSVEETQRSISGKPLGVVDLWGGLKTRPAGFEIRTFADEAKAREELRKKEIASFVVVPADYLRGGRLKIVSMRRLTVSTADRPPVPPRFDDWLLENILAGVEPDRLARARNPMPFSLEVVDAEGRVSGEDGLAALKRAGTAYAFFILLFVSIFTSSQYLLQGMAEEKENRVMEMVLSSVTPDQLLLGKLLGLGAAGLLQLFVWVAMGVTGIVAFAVQVVLAPAAFAVCFVYFLLGYLLFGSLMLGFGALGANFRESQQMASVWSLVGISPIFVLVALLENPQGTIPRIFSYVPFTAPPTMMFRYTIDPAGTPWIDLAGSIAVLLLATLAALKVSARLYRVGLLLYGKRPTLREILRWILRSA